MLDEICLGGITLLHSVYEHINSNMYVLLAEDEALIIDPHKNEELTELLKNNGIKRVTIFLTHEHHDHTTGVYWYQEQFESMLICQQKAAEYIARRQYLRPTLIAFILGEEDHINGTHVYEDFKKSFVPRQYYADITFDEEYTINWHNYTFLFYHIPGHSQGSSLIILDDQYAFTGDSLLKELPIIIRFPGSNKEDYLNKTLPFLNQLISPDMTILPGHGAPFALKEIIENNHIHVQFR